jgi:hypothetical protein
MAPGAELPTPLRMHSSWPPGLSCQSLTELTSGAGDTGAGTGDAGVWGGGCDEVPVGGRIARGHR